MSFLQALIFTVLFLVGLFLLFHIIVIGAVLGSIFFIGWLIYAKLIKRFYKNDHSQGRTIDHDPNI